MEDGTKADGAERGSPSGRGRGGMISEATSTTVGRGGEGGAEETERQRVGHTEQPRKARKKRRNLQRNHKMPENVHSAERV